MDIIRLVKTFFVLFFLFFLNNSLANEISATKKVNMLYYEYSYYRNSDNKDLNLAYKTLKRFNEILKIPVNRYSVIQRSDVFDNDFLKKLKATINILELHESQSFYQEKLEITLDSLIKNIFELAEDLNQAFNGFRYLGAEHAEEAVEFYKNHPEEPCSGVGLFLSKLGLTAASIWGVPVAIYEFPAITLNEWQVNRDLRKINLYMDEIQNIF